MPNTNRLNIGQFIQSGNPDTENVLPPTLLTGGVIPPGTFFPYAAGELGGSFDVNDRTYEIVFNDSGATSATATGAPAIGQVAFWKSHANRIVTNDQLQAIGGQTANAARNQVAGIYRVAAGAGAKICILTRGYNIPVASDGTGGVGQTAIADGTTATARVTPIAVGTAPTYKPIGIIRGAAAAGLINVDVDIPNLP